MRARSFNLWPEAASTMSYQIQPGEDPETGLRRIAGGEIARARAELEETSDPHEAVHEVRKRCKRLRGLLRLHRPALPRYAAENAAIRDTARLLSELRDATSLLETVDALAERYPDELGAARHHAIRSALEARRERVSREQGLEARLDAVRERLSALDDRARVWTLAQPDGGTGGLERVYRRARKGMHRAGRDPSTANLHEWRKRAKYYRYQLRILRPLWPGLLRALHADARLLGDRLGDDHDLAVLEEGLRRDDTGLAAGDRALLLRLVPRRRQELQAWARPVGLRLLALAPKRHGRRIRRAWRAWEHEQELRVALPEGSESVS